MPAAVTVNVIVTKRDGIDVLQLSLKFGSDEKSYACISCLWCGLVSDVLQDDDE